MILFEHAEIATIIAALRFYQQELTHGDMPLDKPERWFDEIATDGGTCVSLDNEEIDNLIENKFQMLQRE